MTKSRVAKIRRDDRQYRLLALLTVMLCLASLYCTSSLAAKGGGAFEPGPAFAPPAIPPQFDITGFIQNATLDTTGNICQVADARLAGGTLKVNGIEIVVPCNTVLQMPAATLTWQEVFSLAPRDIGLPLDSSGIPTQTGLALSDTVTLPVATPYNGPLPSYEAHVLGNVVNGKYIAGLIFLSQHSLSIGQGTIAAIDYENGELLVATSGGDNPTTARVRINDPLGRFGKTHGGPGSGAMLIEPGYDARFSVDSESPTIHATTGYPLCLPRSANDPDCPPTNRPRSPHCRSLPSPFPAFVKPLDGSFCTSFVMDPPDTVEAVCGTANDCRAPSDPTRQAPLEVGDFIDFLGTLKVDAAGAYISAHTIAANLGIYTTPGTMPAYVGIEAVIQGTSAQPLPNLAQEATSRIKVEGFSTDPLSLVDIFAVDVDPQSGALTDRWLGTGNPSGPPVIGRFRFMPNAGAYLPPTREIRIVSRALCGDNFSPCYLGNATLPSPLPANGLIAGQYHAPTFEFIFAENTILGDASVSANFQDLPFLYCGSGPLTTPTAGESGGPLVRQLNPAPWAPPMPTPSYAATLCSGEPAVGAVAVATPNAPPVIKTFPADTLTVNSSAAVFLSASASDSSGLPVAITWVHTGGSPLPSPPMVPPGQPNAITFNAPVGPTEEIFTVIATNQSTGLSSTGTVTVTVTGRASDTVVIKNAAWTSSLKNRGNLQVIASTDAPLDANGQPLADLQLYVQASTMVASLVPDGNGYLNWVTSAVQLSATPLSMFYGDTGDLQVCPAGEARCWQFVTSGALVDPNGTGVFIPPDSITVTSSYGGSSTLDSGSILLK